MFEGVCLFLVFVEGLLCGVDGLVDIVFSGERDGVLLFVCGWIFVLKCVVIF